MLQENEKVVKAEWEAILQQGDEPYEIMAAHFALGSLAYQDRAYRLVIYHQQQTLNFKPNATEAIRQIAWSYIELSEDVEALVWCDKLLVLLPDDAITHYNKGVLWLRQRNFSIAAHCFQIAIKLDPAQIDARVNLAMLALKQDNQPEAIAQYQKILALCPTHEIAHYMLSALTENKSWSNAPDIYLKQLYDRYAEDYEENMVQQLNYCVPQQLLAMLGQHIKLLQAGWGILDLGCGTGLGGKLFSPYAKKLVGVDISQNMLNYACEKQLYAELHCVTIEDYLMGREACFDLVFAADSLLYTGALTNVVAKVAIALRPLGNFIFSVEMLSDDRAEKGYALQSSGRFAHREAYLKNIANDVGLRWLDCQIVILRQQRGEPVLGLIVLLQKTELI